MDPTFFATAKAFRAWLKANHAKADELVVGFHKKHTGVPSITRSEAVDQALCFGWIDGVIRSLEGGRHSVRFTPRRKGSIWSAVNIKRVAELDELGLMTAAGRTVFDGRDPTKAKKYSLRIATAGWTRTPNRRCGRTRRPGRSGRRSLRPTGGRRRGGW